MADKLKIAVIGQSQFGAEVFKLLQKQRHEIVGVFTIPDVQGREDPLGKVMQHLAKKMCQKSVNFERLLFLDRILATLFMGWQ